MAGHRHQAFNHAGLHVITRNSKCPIHQGVHNIRYCPTLKQGLIKLEAQAKTELSTEKAPGQAETPLPATTEPQTSQSATQAPTGL